MYKLLCSIFLYALLISCIQSSGHSEKTRVFNRSLAKFEHAQGVLLFVGQELESIGGLQEPYDDGYLDHYRKPYGFTMYTNFSPGDTSFGYIQKGLDGLKFLADWGDSPSHIDMQLGDEDFAGMALSIGLSLVNNEEKVAIGEHDDLIFEFGEWANSVAPREIFLRIGYEFDGHTWNHYNRESYVKAYQRIKDKLDAQGVENVAYVWQSTGWVSDQYQLEEWYPGDEYVDWCGTSFFNRWKEIEMFDFARNKGKPVFVAEAAPTISAATAKFDNRTLGTDLSNPSEAKLAWDRWFVPFFKTIRDNKEVIKAVSYISCNWQSHAMWRDNPVFQNVDSRLHISPMIDSLWRDQTSQSPFILAQD